MRAKIILFALFMTGAPGLTFALALSEIDINAGLMYIGSAPPGAPSPVVQTLGASLLVQTGGPLFFEPSIDFFGSYYVWNTTVNRAVPSPYENAESFLTIGSLIGLQAGMVFPVAKDLEMGGAVGIDFLIRFPLEFPTGTGDGLTYFYSEGRFVFPETRFITRWDVTDGVTLVFTLRGMYPLFHLWDGESLPFYDQLLAAFNLGFVISLGGKPKPAAAAQPAAPAQEVPAPEAPAAAAPAETPAK